MSSRHRWYQAPHHADQDSRHALLGLLACRHSAWAGGIVQTSPAAWPQCRGGWGSVQVLQNFSTCENAPDRGECRGRRMSVAASPLAPALLCFPGPCRVGPSPSFAACASLAHPSLPQSEVHQGGAVTSVRELPLLLSTCNHYYYCKICSCCTVSHIQALLYLLHPYTHCHAGSTARQLPNTH